MNNIQLDSDLLPVYTDIMAATRPEDVFSPTANQLPLLQQQFLLDQKFATLQKIVNPDQYTRVVDADAAADAAAILDQLYEEASVALEIGSTMMSFDVRDVQYQVRSWITYDTHSAQYKALRTKGAETEEVVLSIATKSEGSDILKTQAEYLRSFRAVHSNSPIARVTETLPQIIDSFNVEGAQVNVLPYYHEYRRVTDVINYFHHEIPVGHAAWIARRMLAFPLTAAMAGVEHTAMTFDHLLVHPVTHEPIYTGWGYAKPSPGTHLAKLDMRETFVRVRELFLTERGGPVAGTPPELADYLKQQCLQEKTVDGVEALSEFTELVYATLGKKYRPLKLN